MQESDACAYENTLKTGFAASENYSRVFSLADMRLA
jgi:hypothetical protein